ncbi:MAG: hypothetical protein ACI8ZM_003819 [Crocinitomix sp.]|jgi:hypothetical protein
MKAIKLIVCLLLLSSAANYSKACSYYPMGEDIRFSLFSSNVGDGSEMSYVFYNSHYLSEYTKGELMGPDENIEEWYAFFDNKIPRSEIDQLIYRVPYDKPYPQITSNELYLHFKSGKNEATKEYIHFAKKVEYLLVQDYWDKKVMDIENSELALEVAIKRSKSAKLEILKLRYAYQALVLAYYLNEHNRVISIYENLIVPQNSTSVIATWSLFYYANMIDDSNERWRLMAIVFEKSRSKNHFIFRHFPKEKKRISEILEKCQSAEEKAAVLSICAFKNPARAIDQIKEIAATNANSKMIDVLLVREINKMEDWYYTNRYTGFGKSIEPYEGSDNYEAFKFFDEKNFESDKKYLKRVMIETKKILRDYEIPNKALWNTSLAYMGYMLDDQETTMKYLAIAEQFECTRTIKGQLKTIEILSLVKFEDRWDNSFQDKLLTEINEVKTFKKELYNYDRFFGQIMMNISRKYLDDGEVVLAALFEAQVSGDTHEEYHDWSSTQYQGFDLLNENADSKDMEKFFAKWNDPEKTQLESFLYDHLEDFKWRYTDLWGTTYLREDKLEKALEVYETIPDSVWEVTNRDYHYYYKQELNANPFDTRFSASIFGEDRSISYTKPDFVRELIRLKNEVKTNSKNRAYNYMLIGNAYYNMTYDGNSWYYSEYAWSTVEASEYASWNYFYKYSRQNADYTTGDRAKKHYELAEETSKSEEFSAFCYRLQYKCLTLKTSFEQEKYARSRYKEEFKAKYPDHYEDLSGCDRFDYYFSKWKDA